MARSPRGRQRLQRVAAPLAPKRPPYHIDAPHKGHPSPGWYWQPAGVAHPAYLGFNHIHAEMALLVELDRAGVGAPQESWASGALP
ncbi:MAG TPA: hypothetical protein VMY78_09970 [Solirubrobacteraceae bacterium]|nr:hypothetical protein [Solirubrobacteraceae bacterium]